MSWSFELDRSRLFNQASAELGGKLRADVLVPDSRRRDRRGPLMPAPNKTSVTVTAGRIVYTHHARTDGLHARETNHVVERDA